MAEDPWPDDRQTVSWYGYLPRDAWRPWTDALARPIHVRLDELLRADADSPTPPADADTAERVIAVERGVWTDWLGTIPQTERVDARLTDLIERDVRDHQQADRDLEDATARVIGQRLSIRATQARGALRDDEDGPDIDQAMQILDDVVELAAALKEH